jgi:hypothetical protein
MARRLAAGNGIDKVGWEAERQLHPHPARQWL